MIETLFFLIRSTKTKILRKNLHKNIKSIINKSIIKLYKKLSIKYQEKSHKLKPIKNLTDLHSRQRSIPKTITKLTSNISLSNCQMQTIANDSSKQVNKKFFPQESKIIKRFPKISCVILSKNGIISLKDKLIKQRNRKLKDGKCQFNQKNIRHTGLNKLNN